MWTASWTGLSSPRPRSVRVGGAAPGAINVHGAWRATFGALALPRPPSPSSGLERNVLFACLAGQREETWLPDWNGAWPSPPGLAPDASPPSHSCSHGRPRQRPWRSRSFAAHPPLDRNQPRRQAGHPEHRKSRRLDGRRVSRETWRRIQNLVSLYSQPFVTPRSGDARRNAASSPWHRPVAGQVLFLASRHSSRLV